MKSHYFKVLILFLSVFIAFSSCKKSARHNVVPVNSTNPTPKQDPIIFTYTENVVEQVTQELTKSISEIIEKKQEAISLCATSFDTIQNSDTNLVLKYTFNPSIICKINGVPVKQSGALKISFYGSHDWLKKGDVLKYEFLQYRIYPVCDTCNTNNYSVEINGSQQRENISGGNETTIQNDSSFVFQIFSRNLTYSYPDKKDRITNQKQLVRIIRSGNEMTTIITGNDSISTGDFAGQTKVSFWGTIWNGKPYMVKYEIPKIYKTCNGNGKIVCGSVYSVFKGAYEKRENYGVDPFNSLENKSCNCNAINYFSQSIIENGVTTTKLFKY